ncbi:DUF1294 domain-containing protein [Undibacterium sp. WLHG33]|uniref:DUF1294 domain-containing protein n=1 Tax=Undibacterium sp. WLHG33 TaxID=3412482 RepID=UPI003C2CC51D
MSYLLILALTLSYYLLLSLLCFLVYFYDKQAAIQRRSRVPEKKLLLLSLIGGWPGALLAHKFLRHKSVKRSFLRWFFLMLVLHWLFVLALLAACVFFSTVH